MSFVAPPNLVSSFSNKTLNMSQTLQLSCCFTGYPLPSITWLHKGTILLNDTNNVMITNTINYTHIQSSLVIKKLQYKDNGQYLCSGNNNVPNYVGYIQEYSGSVTVLGKSIFNE